MKPSIGEIAAATAAHYEIRLADLLGRHAARAISWPRQVAMYLSRQMTDRSYPEIAEFFRRDHTTVIHAVGQVPRRFDTSGELVDVLAIAAHATMLCRTRCERDMETALAIRLACLSPNNDLPSNPPPSFWVVPEQPRPKTTAPPPARRIMVVAQTRLGPKPFHERLRAGRA